MCTLPCFVIFEWILQGIPHGLQRMRRQISRKDYKNYGIEVKSTDSLKGGSNGGMAEEGEILTVPIYLADRISFGLGL